MSDPIVWIIMLGFYAPMHFMLPMLILFVTGNETPDQRKQLIRQAAIDAGLSMAVAFVLAATLVYLDQFMIAMAVLFVAMFVPLLRIFIHRKSH